MTDATLLNNVLDKLRSVTKLKRSPKGDGWDVICPFHDDTNPSMKVWDNRGWHCLGCGAGGNIARLSEMLDGHVVTQALPRSSNRQRATSTTELGSPIAEYIYRDEQGEPLFKVVRFIPKSFRQARWTLAGWKWGMRNTRRVLYNLDLIVKTLDLPVVMVEGEKDADLLTRHGILATTCPMGAGKWRGEYGESLRGREVILIPDNDKVGIPHMVAIQTYLTKNKIADVLLARIPERYKDVSEWGAIDKIKEIMDSCQHSP